MRRPEHQDEIVVAKPTLQNLVTVEEAGVLALLTEIRSIA